MGIDDKELALAVTAADNVISSSDLSGAPFAHLAKAMHAEPTLMYKRSNGRARGLGGRMLSREFLYLRDHMHRDLVQTAIEKQPPGFVCSFEQLKVDRATLLKDEIFNAFYLRNGWYHMVGIWLDGRRFVDPGMFGMFLTRPRRAKPFLPSELEGLLHVRRAFDAAGRRCRRYNESRSVQFAGSDEWGLGAETPTLCWHASGEFKFMNWPAERLLGPHFHALGPLHLGARAFASETSKRNRLYQVNMRMSEWVVVRAELCLRQKASGESFVLATVELGVSRVDQTPLTQRELSILRELVANGSNKEIAHMFGISTNTVKTHLQHMCKKLKVDNRRHLTRIARNVFAPEYKRVDVPVTLYAGGSTRSYHPDH